MKDNEILNTLYRKLIDKCGVCSLNHTSYCKSCVYGLSMQSLEINRLLELKCQRLEEHICNLENELECAEYNTLLKLYGK